MVSPKTKGKLDPITGQPKNQPHDENLRVRARVNAQVEARERSYGMPCRCPCGCRVRHRFGDTCVLCRDNDHWFGLDRYLEKIARRGT